MFRQRLNLLKFAPTFIIIIICCCCSCWRVDAGAPAPVTGSAYATALRTALRQLRHAPSNTVSELGALQQTLMMPAGLVASLERLVAVVGAVAPGRCAADLKALIDAVSRGEFWALQFADAMGKPQPGLLQGATTWLGSFDQCLATSSGQPWNISGAYCLMKLELTPSCSPGNASSQCPAVTVGTCWPDSCSMADAVNATSFVLRELLHLGITAVPANHECRPAKIKISPGAIVMIAILGIACLCTAAGTGIDLYERSRARSALAAAAARVPPPDRSVARSSLESSYDSSGVGGDESAALITAIGQSNHRPVAFRYMGCLKSVLLCFSLPANASKILSMQTPAGDLHCVNGIRFLSMSWVILGHTYYIGLMGASNIGQLAPKLINNWTFQAVINATVAVDTFFVLSGLLAAYLFLRELDIQRGQLRRINWVRFYLHRYWRLTAPYMLILGAYATLAQYLYDGPRYPVDGFDANCETKWWYNLLYINNLFFKVDEMCMPWSWYLTNDMQFYALSPLLLIPIALKPALGAAAAACVILASTIALGVHSTLSGQQAGSLTDTGLTGDYAKPWFRIGPYVVGTLAGLIAHRTLASGTGGGHQRRAAIRLHWALRSLGWVTALGLCYAAVYSLYDVQRGRAHLSQPLGSLYNSTFRLGWAAAVAWTVLACASGNGGCISGFLSARVFAPLSRLSYCAYLLHPALMVAVETARRDTMQWDDWTPIGNYLAYLLGTYLLAFAASLLLESPLIGLERWSKTRESR